MKYNHKLIIIKKYINQSHFLENIYYAQFYKLILILNTKKLYPESNTIRQIILINIRIIEGKELNKYSSTQDNSKETIIQLKKYTIFLLKCK